MCVSNLWCVYMFSPEFMKFLINYQKNEFKTETENKVIYLKTPRRGRKILAEVFATVTNK